MDWIKRNLIFVIGAVVAVVLMALAGWYAYGGYSRNAAAGRDLYAAYEELQRLNTLRERPGDGKKVDNIKLAREQEKEAREFVDKQMTRLIPVPALPPGTNLAAKDYSAALQRTIDELGRDATNHSVVLPPGYKFSFTEQARRVTFAPGSLEPLAAQLGEVKAICSIVNAAKINALDGVRRQRVSVDDSTGPATDYIDAPGLTNELGVLVPYEVTVRCFSGELALLLAGFANTPHGLVVKGVNVETAATSVLTDAWGMPMTPTPEYVPRYVPAVPEARRSAYGEGEGMPDAFRSRYGVGGGRMPVTRPPAVAPTPVPLPATAQARTGLQPFLQEKQLKVTLLVHVIRPPAPM